MLTGVGVDQYFQRSGSSGTADFLTDALGSTIALTGPSGAIVARYVYAPYGAVTPTGSLSNAFQFTGQESDPGGLAYFRARYYSAEFGRFISQDPLGMAGSGANLFVYASDDPINLVDPYGTFDWWDLLYGFSNFANGYANMVTGGMVAQINAALGDCGAIDNGSAFFKLGSLAGFVAGQAMGDEEVDAYAAAEQAEEAAGGDATLYRVVGPNELQGIVRV